jgi:hypothetical protein
VNSLWHQVEADLRWSFGYFPLASLLHLRENSHRLIRGKFRVEDRGCLFNLLSEVLAPAERIASPAALTRHFTGRSGFPACEEPQYQPARWLVRLIDGLTTPRYGDINFLPWHFVLKCLDAVIAERLAAEEQSRQREQNVAERLRKSETRPAATTAA